MARQHTPDNYTKASSHGLRENEVRNAGNGRVFVEAPKGYPGQKYIKDRWAPGGRYAYRSQVEAWRETGRVAKDGEVVHHTTEPYDKRKFTRSMDKAVRLEQRNRHYKSGHGRPGARPKSSPWRPIMKAR